MEGQDIIPRVFFSSCSTAPSLYIEGSCASPWVLWGGWRKELAFRTSFTLAGVKYGYVILANGTKLGERSGYSNNQVRCIYIFMYRSAPGIYGIGILMERWIF